MKAITDTIARECLALRVRSLNRVVTSIYDEALRPLGLTINQLTMLVVLSQMGEATAKEIGSFLQMERSTISRNLERMRKGGLVKATPGSDARSVQLMVSPRGARLIQKASPAWEKAQTRTRTMLGNMSTKALSHLSGIMK